MINTARLTIRQLKTEDAAFIFRLLNQQSWIKYIGDRNIQSLEDANHYILAGPMASYSAHGFGLYCVVEQRSNEAIGLCGLLKREFLDGPDIGYALLDGYAGQGYISEACLAVLHYELERNTFKKVYAFTTPDNQKSIKVLERLGMKFIEQIKAGVDTEAKNLYAIYLANTAIPDHHP